MVNCLIIGHGAREHVIGEALVNSGAKLFAFMSFKNAGLEDLSKDIKVHSETDFKEIIDFSKAKKIINVMITMNTSVNKSPFLFLCIIFYLFNLLFKYFLILISSFSPIVSSLNFLFSTSS